MLLKIKILGKMSNYIIIQEILEEKAHHLKSVLYKIPIFIMTFYV